MHVDDDIMGSEAWRRQTKHGEACIVGHPAWHMRAFQRQLACQQALDLCNATLFVNTNGRHEYGTVCCIFTRLQSESRSQAGISVYAVREGFHQCVLPGSHNRLKGLSMIPDPAEPISFSQAMPCHAMYSGI